MVTPGLESLPTTVRIGSSPLTVRRMGAADRDGMLAFARSLPAHDLLFLRRDITDPVEVDAWVDDIEAGRTTTILALSEDSIVGYAAVARSGLGWMDHVAELRVLVAEPLRRVGLGRVLTNEAFHAAVDMGIEKMVAQMTPDQEEAIGIFYRMGFEQEARLRDHVRDRDGRKHDLIVLSHDVSAYQAARRDRRS